ncbi:MAG: hypothetical protein A4E28_00498 [Methanocella sp. PtaU1.Bin125]|nr:MAG: hypothetical protein A4E28_00498 [Methanocella sp. PtaU1.Bin125]
MKIELDGIPLDKTEESATGGIPEARSISGIVSSARRNYVMHPIPGMDGCVFQDMGRTAVRISFDGAISGKSAISTVEMLRARFKGGAPVPFNSDVSGASDITQVVIEDFKVSAAAGNKNRYTYSIVLKEYKEPAA